MSEQSNKRIAKNTIMLYIRTLLIMTVSLYTVRIVLKTLGVEDYGIYNVVGGVVVALSVINASLSGASSRFIAFAIGKKDSELLKRYFSAIKLIHWFLAGIILLIGETLGLWFVISQLVIPEERLLAAVLCYQFSLCTSIVSVISVPYNSMIMGHEKMDVYAYISILEVVLKLLVVFFLDCLPYDKLITYGVLLLTVQLCIRIVYNIYCRRTFVESKIKTHYDKAICKEVLAFSGWNFTGQLAYIGYTQGLNILMNLFFGPVVNAARGVAVQIQNGAGILVKNFQVAVRPQITKCWAQEDFANMHRLVIMSTRMSYYLTAIMVFPLAMFTKPILEIWLTDVPNHSVAFTQIILYTMLIESFSHALIVSIHAVGDLKRFQILETSVLLLVIPVAYVLLKVCGITAEQVMMVFFVIQVFAQSVRIYVVLPKISMSITAYIRGVFPRILLSTLFFLTPLLFLSIDHLANIWFIMTGLMTMVFYVCIITYTTGLTRNEQKHLAHIILQIIHKIGKM